MIHAKGSPRVLAPLTAKKSPRAGGGGKSEMGSTATDLVSPADLARAAANWREVDDVIGEATPAAAEGSGTEDLSEEDRQAKQAPHRVSTNCWMSELQACGPRLGRR